MAIRTIHTRYAEAVHAERLAWLAFQASAPANPDYQVLAAQWRAAAVHVRDLAIELAAAPDLRAPNPQGQGTQDAGG